MNFAQDPLTAKDFLSVLSPNFWRALFNGRDGPRKPEEYLPGGDYGPKSFANLIDPTGIYGINCQIDEALCQVRDNLEKVCDFPGVQDLYDNIVETLSIHRKNSAAYGASLTCKDPPEWRSTQGIITKNDKCRTCGNDISQWEYSYWRHSSPFDPSNCENPGPKPNGS